jgi:sulfofructose kinase
MSAERRAADLVCVGIATLDAIALVDRLPVTGERREATRIRLAGGGVAATAAVAAARLGTAVAFIGRVADDPAGRLVRAGLADEGVDVAGLRTVSGRTPVSVVLVEAGSGERALVPDVGGVPPIELGADDVALCRSAAWVHVDQTGHPPLDELRHAGVRTPVSFDGGNTSRRYPLEHVDLYAPTEAALRARHPGELQATLEAALDEGPSTVVVTMGSAGSLAAVRDAATGAVTVHREPAAGRVPIVSTLGAGDVFHGALLASLIAGRSIATSLRRANAAAALACRELDGRTGIPTADELDAFLREQEAGHAD